MLDRNGAAVIQFIASAIEEVRDILESHPSRLVSTCYSSSLVYDGSVGRPRYDVPISILEFLIESRFSVPQIAEVLRVSVRTVRRQMTEYGLSVRATYTSISQQELDAVVAAIQQQFPFCGYRQMQGHLVAQGLRIQQERVRESQRRIDPGGCVMRQLSTINRRIYCVNGQLALWHIDGNHKLIK